MLGEVAPGIGGKQMNGRRHDFSRRLLGKKLLVPEAPCFADRNPQYVRTRALGMQLKSKSSSRASNRSGFTLVETMMSLVIIAMFFSTVLVGYMGTTNQAIWTGYSLAATAQATRQLEEFRAVLWDTQSIPVVDNTTNIPSRLVLPLDLPVSGTNVLYATNIATVTTLTNLGSGAMAKMIVITTTWPFQGKTFTNTLVDYRSPDQ
jgi:prepilin-type N-terminal cleavage/methylation domain-containing protein